jgi:hypothetical protein
MSWIKDIREEVSQLDFSSKKLRNFGLLMGGIGLFISAWLYVKRGLMPSEIILLSLSLLIILSGILVPNSLKCFFKLWMTLGAAIGWLVSKLLLLILFYLILTPVALVARLFAVRFLDAHFKDRKESYWVNKTENVKNYEKMY